MEREMTTSTRRLTRWAVAAAGAMTLGLFGMAAPAAAVGPNLPDTEAGDLTIHKSAEPDVGGEEHDGTELPTADTDGLTPLDGVTFTVEQIDGVDLFEN